jgi:uncharacterized protein (TIGR03435 family)
MGGRRAKCVRHPRRRVELAAFLVAACLPLAIPALAQTDSAAPRASDAGPTQFVIAFAVSSVKPSKPDCPGLSVNSLSGHFSAQCTTFADLLSDAYPIKTQDSIPGMPGWGTSELFDVDAKADDPTAAAMEKLPRDEQSKLTQQMIQKLLGDRFKLRVHNESRKEPIYTLALARGGAKLQDAPESETSSGTSWGTGHIQVRKGPIGNFASSLSNVLGRPVIDKTGITGNYDIDLRWATSAQQDAESAVASALEELGLKLEPTKGMVDVFIIDHVERPSGN